MHWVWRAEAGAGKTEYAALLVVVAGVVVAVLAFGMPGDVRSLMERAMCLIPGDEDCEELAGSAPDDSTDEASEPAGDDGDGTGENDETSEGNEEQASNDNDDPSEEEGTDAGEGEDEGEYDPELAQELEDAEGELEGAEDELEEAQSSYDEIFDELLDLLKDLIGLEDAEKCLTEGDIVACIWTVVGFAPWGKAAKVAKRIPAIARLVTRWRRRSGRLDSAEDAADSARRRRDDALDACGTGSGGKNSFPAGTPVLLADGGTVAIEDIERFDEVLATDAGSGLTEGRPVRGTLSTFGQKDLVNVTVLGDTGGEQVTATDHHRFWVQSEQQWVAASELTPGDQLRAPDGGSVTVAGLAEFRQRQAVHNLTVHELHTYYVTSGGSSVLVHNKNNKKNDKCDPGDTRDPREPDSPAPPGKVDNALKDFESKNLKFGNGDFLIDKSGIKHALKRHHPNYWDGSKKKNQTFFDDSMSPTDVRNAAEDVMKQNRDELVEHGTNGSYQIRGTVNGEEYVVGITNGKVGQIYPVYD